MNKVYLQMYSFGEFDPSLTISHLEAAAKMGYAGVELFAANLAIPAETIKAAAKANNLEVVSFHGSTDQMIELIPYAKTLGLRFMGIGMEQMADHNSVLAFARRLDEIGEQCAKEGIMLTYHNHTQEFNEYGGEIVLETLIANTNPEYVGFELDAGWCAAAGTNPVDFIQKHAGRIKLIHVKETNKVIGPEPPMDFSKLTLSEEGFPIFTEEQKAEMQKKVEMDCATGEGLTDWNAVKQVADAQGCQYYIVEREYTYAGTRQECLQADFDYCKNHIND